MRTRLKWNFASKATAPGATVPQAELFILKTSIVKNMCKIIKKQTKDHNKSKKMT